MLLRAAFTRRRWQLAAVVCLAASLVTISGQPPADASGGTVTNYTGSGISRPVGIADGPDGALWFTNSGNNSIGRITTGGTVTNYTGSGISNPQDITDGPDGALWFTNSGNNSIGRITTTGTVTNYTGSGISDPVGITAGPDGALWFANHNGGSIGRITTSGTITYYTDTASRIAPIEITAGPDRALWFTNDDTIGRITTSGKITKYTGHGINHPQGITAGPDGALWFPNVGSAGSIGRITTSGNVTNYTGIGIERPEGITAGPDGALWFTDDDSESIGRITTSGAVTSYDDLSINQRWGIAAGPANPANPRQSPDPALWYTNSSNNSLGRITAVGPPVSSVAFTGSAASPQVVITGSGFGQAPPQPGYAPKCGHTGRDYGYYLHLNDTTAGWDAGRRTVSGGTDCVGLIVQSWTNTQIVLSFGSDYGKSGQVLNPGDAYTLSAFTTSYTGTVKY